MFIYLSKKIAIPDCESLYSIAWNNSKKYIATGGNGGLLKVIKLDSAVGSSLSMNQTLEGHSGTVLLTTWNNQHDKLASADSTGKIIVWVLFKGMWHEELVNDRKKGMVADMKWDKAGSRICIVYEDGAVVVGSVEGTRIWGKDIKSTNLVRVSWSPDGNYLLFVTLTGQIQIFDALGNFIYKLQNYCHPSDLKVAAIDWYNGLGGLVKIDTKRLAVCFEDGKVQILNNERDSNPILFDVGMKGIKMEWNNNGTILAFSGHQSVSGKGGEQKEINLIQFWNSNGLFLKSIRVPGGKITSISWESDGLRLAATIETFIFFASVRPDYNWTYFAGHVLVYTERKADTSKCVLKFWDTKTNEKISKSVDELVTIQSAGELCLVVTRSNNGFAQYLMTLYNAIGIAVDFKDLEFEPKYFTISNTTVVVSNDNVVFSWQFKPLATTGISPFDAMRRKEFLDKAFHIDDILSSDHSEISRAMLARPPSQDPISSISSSDQILIVARQSGMVFELQLPSLTLNKKIQSPIIPVSMNLNCDSDLLSVIDRSGALRVIQINSKSDESNNFNTTVLDIDKKDVWDFKWATDSPSMFAIMEKTRLVVFNGLEAEEAIPSPGYICCFENLVVKTAMLDDIITGAKPEDEISTLVTSIDVSLLRDLKEKLDKEPIENALEFVKNHSHLRLWQELAKSGLKQLNLEIANNAFVRCQDYQGIQFLKRLRKLEVNRILTKDPQKKKAEVLAYCCEFDEAEKLYLSMDRKDLAIDLRARLGDSFKVVQLIKSGGGADDATLAKAWNEIGDYYFDRKQLPQAISYYQQAGNVEKLIECYFSLDDYSNAEKLASNLTENSKQLNRFAEKFLAAGFCQPACNAYFKLGNISGAIQACVTLNQWDMAISLAEKHQFLEIEGYLLSYAKHILGKNRKKEAVELFRRANYCLHSAKLIFEMANEAVLKDHSPATVKKLFVLGALEVERHFVLQRNSKSNGHVALDKLLEQNNNSECFSLQNPWRGAEAYHFYLLAQRQFYTGHLVAAVTTTLHLTKFDDILGETKVYSLLAFISLHAGYYATCSKAFIKLESLPDSNEVEFYKSLALDIFISHPPQDPNDLDILACPNCAGPVKEL